MNREIDDDRSVLYTGHAKVVQTPVFERWIEGLRDRKARLRIDVRLKRLAAGNAGDTKSVGDGVQEMRLHFGPGYRIYYMWQGDVLVVLLNGGDKDSQSRDIAKARAMAREAQDGIEGCPI